jgi:hypothetical protein
MKYIASSDTDKARFYISNAPRTAFSTAVLNVSDFNVQMFFDIFERHIIIIIIKTYLQTITLQPTLLLKGLFT